MPKRLFYSLAAILLIASATVLIWQGSFPGNFGSISPEDPEQTFIFYGISIVIFLLMTTLGFMLMRLMIKLWIDRRADRPGSRIRTKLMVGALLLSLMPVFFMVFFSFYVLSATLQRWFSGPLQARGQALYTSISYGLGGTLGGLILGMFWETFGPWTVYVMAALFSLAGAAAAALSYRWQPQHTEKK